MALSARHPFTTAVIFVALAVTAGVFIFARPQYHRDNGTTVTLPAKQPAADAPGAAGWVWPDGTPGWKAGERVKNYLVSGVQSVELDAARLAAARAGLDADGVRVVASLRGSRKGVLAVLAAPTIGQTPVKTCLAALLEGDTPVLWRCPGATHSPHDLARSHVLVAAARYTWTDRGQAPEHPLYLVGLARGDVHRVVLVAPGLRQTLYTRGTTWGQFDSAVTVSGGARLRVYDRRGLVQTLPLDLAPGTSAFSPASASAASGR
jgi:hypothetical protein